MDGGWIAKLARPTLDHKHFRECHCRGRHVIATRNNRRFVHPPKYKRRSIWPCCSGDILYGRPPAIRPDHFPSSSSSFPPFSAIAGFHPPISLAVLTLQPSHRPVMFLVTYARTTLLESPSSSRHGDEDSTRRTEDNVRRQARKANPKRRW
jgi:hypothetical protein